MTHHRLSSTRTIQKGEQIYISYNLCYNCGSRSESGRYGTAEIFSDYGFIEMFPQRWHYTQRYYAFDLYEEENNKTTTTTKPTKSNGSNDPRRKTDVKDSLYGYKQKYDV